MAAIWFQIKTTDLRLSDKETTCGSAEHKTEAIVLFPHLKRHLSNHQMTVRPWAGMDCILMTVSKVLALSPNVNGKDYECVDLSMFC